MRYWILALLLVLPTMALAADFCVGGQAHPLQCLYDDVRACRAAAQPPGSVCIINPEAVLSYTGGSRFCTVDSSRTAQCFYADRLICVNEASRTQTICVDRNGLDDNNPFRFDDRVQN